jgi:hypothetical protein
MTPDQLFEELRSERSAEKRQQLVAIGLNNGISPAEITEMLDYLDLCASVKQPLAQVAVDANKRPATSSSIWQSLVCTFRLR